MSDLTSTAQSMDTDVVSLPPPHQPPLPFVNLPTLYLIFRRPHPPHYRRDRSGRFRDVHPTDVEFDLALEANPSYDRIETGFHV